MLFKTIKEGKKFGPREWMLYGMFAVVLVAGAGAASQITWANADYICTQVVDSLSSCSNGSWGAWQVTSSSENTAACIRTTVSQRTYTGTRVSSHTLSYLNLRTACQSGYAQQQVGSRGGASGNQGRGGTIITQTSACQIQQTATARAGISSGGSCTAAARATSTSFTSDTTDTAAFSSNSVSVGSVDELNAAYSHLSGGNLTVQPSLVHSGDSTVVSWKSQIVTACTVTGSNGDSWAGLKGQQNSGPIKTKTTYTLSCTASDGTPITETASVDVIPSWQEI